MATTSVWGDQNLLHHEVDDSFEFYRDRNASRRLEKICRSPQHNDLPNRQPLWWASALNPVECPESTAADPNPDVRWHSLVVKARGPLRLQVLKEVLPDNCGAYCVRHPGVNGRDGHGQHTRSGWVFDGTKVRQRSFGSLATRDTQPAARSLLHAVTRSSRSGT